MSSWAFENNTTDIPMGEMESLHVIQIDEESVLLQEKFPIAVRVLAGTLLSILCVNGIMGNLLVILSVYFDKKLRNTTSKLVLNLSIVSILINLFTLPPYIANVLAGRLLYSAFTCGVIGLFNYSLLLVLLGNLVVVAIHQCLLLMVPGTKGKRLNKITLILLWSIPVFVAICALPFYGFNSDQLHCIFQDSQTKDWHSFALVAVPTALALISICVCYILIIKQLRDSKSRLASHENMEINLPGSRNCHQQLRKPNLFKKPHTELPGLILKPTLHQKRPLRKRLSAWTCHHHQELKLLKHLVINYTTFCVLWAPLMILYLLDGLMPLPSESWLICSILARSYTSINWMLHGYLNKQFSTAYKNVLCLRYPCCRKRTCNKVSPVKNIYILPMLAVE